MTDPIDQSEEGTTASDQPGGNGSAPDLKAIVAEAVAAALSANEAATDKRFKGFQSLVDKKLGELSRQFQTASLTPEEQEQLADDDTEALRRELEIYRMRDQFPEAAGVMLDIARAETLDEQLDLIQKALGSGAISQEQATQAVETAVEAEASTDPDPAVPEVDRNNPGRDLKPGLATATSGGMNEESADAILQAFDQKGALRQG